MKGSILKSILLCLILPKLAFALSFPLPSAGNSIVGRVYTVTANGDQTLGEIGRQHDIGFYEMVEANPNLSPNHVGSGQQVVIPAKFILPPGRQGLVINLAELRLYYYPKNSSSVITMPVGIGRQGWQTPKATTTIVQKRTNPSWTPPKSVREYQESYGLYLPEVVPPGPDNPLGAYAMRLGLGDYLIHGTNEPWRVGERASAGCIRMFPEDIEALFPQVPIGTKVQIIDQPYMVGWSNGNLYLQAHLPLSEYRNTYGDGSGQAVQLVKAAIQGRNVAVNWDAVHQSVAEQNGIPQIITSSGGTSYASADDNSSNYASSDDSFTFSGG